MTTATIYIFVAGPVKMLAGQVKFFITGLKSLALIPGVIFYAKDLQGLAA